MLLKSSGEYLDRQFDVNLETTDTFLPFGVTLMFLQSGQDKKLDQMQFEYPFVVRTIFTITGSVEPGGAPPPPPYFLLSKEKKI